MESTILNAPTNLPLRYTHPCDDALIVVSSAPLLKTEVSTAGECPRRLGSSYRRTTSTRHALLGPVPTDPMATSRWRCDVHMCPTVWSEPKLTDALLR